MKLRTLLITVPVIVVLVALALANRGPVRLSLDPFNTAAPAWSVELPLFVVLFLAVFIGILVGGSVAWVAGLKRRHVLKRDNKGLQRELATVQAAVQPQTPPVPHGAANLPAPR